VDLPTLRIRSSRVQPAKALSASKLHLERKHYLEVVVEGEAEKKQAEDKKKVQKSNQST
jgi:hypothetical protein